MAQTQAHSCRPELSNIEDLFYKLDNIELKSLYFYFRLLCFFLVLCAKLIQNTEAEFIWGGVLARQATLVGGQHHQSPKASTPNTPS